MARLDGARVTVRGLDDLRRELKKLDDAGLSEELKEVNQSIAEKVVNWAQAAASTKLERRAAQSLRASRTAARSQITFGGAKAAFAEGAEFGAVKYPQFEAWRGNDSGAGYFLFPSIRSHEDEIGDEYLDAIEKIMHKAFND